MSCAANRAPVDASLDKELRNALLEAEKGLALLTPDETCQLEVELHLSRQERTSDSRYNLRGLTRFELELKKEWAAAAGAEVLRDAVALKTATLGLVRQFVDFVDSASGSNRSRCKLLPIWEDVVDGHERWTVRLEPRPQMTLGRVKIWIETQIAAILVVYEQTQMSDKENRDDTRSSLHRHGMRRISKLHLSLTAFARVCAASRTCGAREDRVRRSPSVRVNG